VYRLKRVRLCLSYRLKTVLPPMPSKHPYMVSSLDRFSNFRTIAIDEDVISKMLGKKSLTSI